MCNQVFFQAFWRVSKFPYTRIGSMVARKIFVLTHLLDKRNKFRDLFIDFLFHNLIIPVFFLFLWDPGNISFL